MSTNYEVRNTRNTLITTVEPLTYDVTTPLTLPGKGALGDVARAYAEDLFHLLENFAGPSAPASPAEGQTWYDTVEGLKVRGTSSWALIATGRSTDVILTRLGTADNINFTTTGSANLHTGATGVSTIVTSLLLKPRSGISVAAGAPPVCALEISTNTGDIADPIVLAGVDNVAKAFRYHVNGVSRIVAAGETIKLNVKQATPGGSVMACDAYIFGIIF